MDIFSRFECLQLPTHSNILKVCEQTARYVYIKRSCAAIREIRKGIPPEHLLFWNAKRLKGLHRVYVSLTASPSKVLELIEEPEVLTIAQQRVLNYLQEFLHRVHEGRGSATVPTICDRKFSFRSENSERHFQLTLWSCKTAHITYMCVHS